MSFYAWMLSLHLIAVFAVASALVLYSVLVVSGRRMSTLAETQALFRVAPVGGPLIGAGMGLALAFGIVLAIDSSDFEIWDGWIVAGIVLWALLGEVGRRSGVYYTDVQKLAETGAGAEAEVIARLRASKGALLHVATVAIFVLLILDMLFKPGA
jgi:predicted outer membrane lipoprotein